MASPLAWAADAPVDFNREVRPILSDRCYGCHGPDADKGRKAGLRLDEIGGATKKLKSGEDPELKAFASSLRSRSQTQVWANDDVAFEQSGPLSAPSAQDLQNVVFNDDGGSSSDE